jgi:cellobiose phosphorylase
MNFSNKVNHKQWTFKDKDGAFEWKNPHTLNQLYFPICNEAGMMASVTPQLHGDATSGQHTFLRLPLVIEDLHNTRSARNFWIYREQSGAYSLTGNSAGQNAKLFTGDDRVDMTVEGDFLSQRVVREDKDGGVLSDILSFCPVTDDKLEIFKVKITNIADEPYTFTFTTALPVYGRSAENLRDHRHWTSLSHRMFLNDYGVTVKPIMHHDEGGHKPNQTAYFVLAADGDGQKPVGQFPTVAEFIGEGGSFTWPQGVVENTPPRAEGANRRDGMEAVGAIRFSPVTLKPGESKEYIALEGITEDENTILRFIERYGSSVAADAALRENHGYWKERVERISFKTGDPHFDTWMHWVALQPILRKIYGNSFLPYFDYGKGGRGWRDLWQDCLALLLQNPIEMRKELVANFGGIRLDGSNATIIQKGLGSFAADRNKISRVWMDHGIWPYYTVRLYINQTGDFDILFEEEPYWKDHQIRRAKGQDKAWSPADGTMQRATDGIQYKGSVLEHMLVQHLTCFYNVGEHNNMRLEDADWNDLLDMANDKGESVAFSSFYGWNLITLSELLTQYGARKKAASIRLFKELEILLNLDHQIGYDHPQDKVNKLTEYFDGLEKGFTGQKAEFDIAKLAAGLRDMGEWVLKHVREKEWIELENGNGFFNGYYNNDSVRVDGEYGNSVHMNLTAQAFAIMSGAADEAQAKEAYKSAGIILKDPDTGGYRLTTPLGPNTWNFGRGFAVVYGEKETGSMFSHMAVMFCNALYQRGLVNEAYEVFSSIYRLVNDTEKAKMYPGIPEYISHEGRGMYTYLTGSASWLLMTVLTEMFGLKGEYGDLRLKPKLVPSQFDTDGRAEVNAFFLGKRIKLIYINRRRLGADEYAVSHVSINGQAVKADITGDKSAIIRKELLEKLLIEGAVNSIEVALS